MRLISPGMQHFLLQAPVTGGFLAALLGPEIPGLIIGNFAGEDAFLANGIMTAEIMEV